MAFRNPFFEFDPFEDLFFNAFKAEADPTTVTGKTDSTIFPRYRAVSDENAMILEIDLPGVDKSTIELDVNRKQLTIAAKRHISTSFGSKPEHAVEAKPEHGVEAKPAHETGAAGKEVTQTSAEKAVSEVRTKDHYLKYAAKFRLGYDVDVAEVQAEFKEGVLRIRAPRHEETARRIEIPH